MEKHIVIVGAGHAGGTVAAMLRQLAHKGRITLIGEEMLAPYQRPPLSKDFLKGLVDIESLKLKHDEFYTAHAIDLKLNVAVEAIDPLTKTVRCQTGEILAYDILIIATGARARPLDVPGHDLAGIFTLRNVADAQALRRALEPGCRLAIIGGGYVGLEVAASARALGVEVTVLERDTRVLARVASPVLSEFFTEQHRAHGVEILCGVNLLGFEGCQGKLSGIRLSDGRLISCDSALVGIGAQPNEEIARRAGLACPGGIEVDEAARTSDPFIYAIGDVTFRPLPLYGSHKCRVESVPSAIEQAKQVAHAIVGRPPPPPEVPWFWSDQYNIKLQIAGIAIGANQNILRGTRADGKFSVFHLRGDHVVAVEAINSTPDFMLGRQLIARKTPILANNINDISKPLKETIYAF